MSSSPLGRMPGTTCAAVALGPNGKAGNNFAPNGGRWMPRDA